MVLFFIFLFLTLASLGVSIYFSVKEVKNTVTKIQYKPTFIRLAICGGIYLVSMLVMFLAIYPMRNISPRGVDVTQAVFGSIFLAITTFVTIHTFILHYYAKHKDEKIDRILFITLMVTFPFLPLAFFLLTNGYADFLTYPLYKAIDFQKGFVTYEDDGGNIAFYALCILTGAVFVYLLCDHKMYLEYGKHGILESTFLVAFPAGIVGARLFYVLGVWEAEFAHREFWHVFDFTEGGLTILGGAAMGIVVGVAWFLWRNKKYSIWVAVDAIVPTILIAQAFGRWGNFFNCEVHGIAVSSSGWEWLPKLIFHNAQFSEHYGYAGDGQLYVPLFFIEGIINLFGFFVLAHLFGKKLLKHTEPGDLAFGYILWYGITRVMLEPLRADQYKMNTWSWYWSFVFVIAGTVAIVVNHLVRRYLRKKKEQFNYHKRSKIQGLIEMIIISVIGVALLISGIIVMASNEYTKEVLFKPFNIGLVLAFFGVTILLLLGISIPRFLDGQRAYQIEEEGHE